MHVVYVTFLFKGLYNLGGFQFVLHIGAAIWPIIWALLYTASALFSLLLLYVGKTMGGGSDLYYYWVIFLVFFLQY